MVMKVFYLIVSALLVAGCVKKNQQVDSPYLDFDSLINAQIVALTKAKSTLTKSVLLDGKSDRSVLAMDSTLLAQELDVFRQLDVINKPLYRDAYEISDGEKDIQSNLIIRTYRAKKKTAIPYVKIYYQNNFSRIKKIESGIQDTNSLYATNRSFQLEFDDAHGALLLSKYKLTGGQKMILSDTVLFTIEGSFSFH